MVKFKHMPEAVWPNENEHVEYDEVNRAVHSRNELTVNDFLPWNIEYKNQKKTFGRLFAQPEYGMSVYRDIDSLKEVVERFPKLSASINAYSLGFTTIRRGISTRENSHHHVEYYLYDYEDNSPKDDFRIIEVR